MFENLYNILEAFRDTLEKIDSKEPKPERKGDYEGEMHVLETERGHRLVRYPTDKTESGFGVKKIPNKVKITHIWDGKDWKHKGTESLISGKPVPKQKVTSTMDDAKAKMKAYEENKKKEAEKANEKPKTIRRKKVEINKSTGQWSLN